VIGSGSQSRTQARKRLIGTWRKSRALRIVLVIGAFAAMSAGCSERTERDESHYARGAQFVAGDECKASGMPNALGSTEERHRKNRRTMLDSHCVGKGDGIVFHRYVQTNDGLDLKFVVESDASKFIRLSFLVPTVPSEIGRAVRVSGADLRGFVTEGSVAWLGMGSGAYGPIVSGEVSIERVDSRTLKVSGKLTADLVAFEGGERRQRVIALDSHFIEAPTGELFACEPDGPTCPLHG